MTGFWRPSEGVMVVSRPTPWADSTRRQLTSRHYVGVLQPRVWHS